jgi:hypothetical protein
MAHKKRKIANIGLASQVKSAKKSIDEWPSWMKETARFEGCTNYDVGHPMLDYRAALDVLARDGEADDNEAYVANLATVMLMSAIYDVNPWTIANDLIAIWRQQGMLE